MIDRIFYFSKFKDTLIASTLTFFIFILSLFIVQLGNEIFIRPCKEIQPSQISILSNDSECKIMRLDSGRFYLAVKEFGNQILRIKFDSSSNPRILMLRAGHDILGGKTVSHLKISSLDGKSIEIKRDSNTFTPRHYLQLPENLECTIENLDNEKGKLVIEEIGLCEIIPNFAKTKRQFFVNTILKFIIICFFASIIFFILERKWTSIFGCFYFFILPIAVHFSVILFVFSPEWGRDLRTYLASEPLQESAGCNLNYGLYMASSILQGKGPLICDLPPWCRMPGYGFILALSGHAFNLLQMAIHSVFLHVLLFASSLVLFFWSALRIMSPFAAYCIATILSFLPFRFFHLQIESFMPIVILICTSASCLFYFAYNKYKLVPFAYHLFLHLSFALWFSNRTDVLPAWAIVSLFLYGNKISQWKYFLIPLTLSLGIGLSWAIFKQPFTGEFSMTTESIGASLMVGLWEIPHKFIWTVSDGAYFSWLSDLNLPFGTKASSNFAVTEVLRFCFTYPVYLVSLILHKFLLYAKTFCLGTAAFPGNWKGLFLITPLILSLTIKYKRLQTFLLAWPIFLNVPVFFLFYSGDGRFYQAPTISLIIASFVLLLDLEFYRKIQIESKKVIAVLGIVLVVIIAGPILDDFLIRNDKIRYWSPFLEPNKSTLNIIKNDLNQ